MEEIMTAEEAIKKKVELEFKMRDFTKYINKTLKESDLAENWCFAVNTMGENTLELTIDYRYGLHSRTVYDVGRYDLDLLIKEFEHLLYRDIDNYNRRIKHWSMYERGE